VEDVAMAFCSVLEAPAEIVAGQAYNVGRTQENHRIRDVADLVAALVGGEVTVGESAGADERNYSVDCRRLVAEVPGVQYRWSVPEGIQQLRDAYVELGLSAVDLHRGTYARLAELGRHREQGAVRSDLRFAGANPGYAA
jgi:nucleoside-diphosphate-sugar epimerase